MILRSKMEKDITKADKTAQKEQAKLKEKAAANKAVDIANLSGGEDGNSDDGSDANDEGSQGNEARKNITADLTKQTAEEVFQQFDTDGSGLIDFDEFRAMLPQVGIKMSMPKVS